MTPSSFEIRFVEWDYLDGSHGIETVSWMVAERGVTTLPSGAVIEAGTLDSTKAWQSFRFASPFSARPGLAMAPLSANGGVTVGQHVRQLSTAGFQYANRAQESNTTARPNETLNYVAWSPGVSASGPRSETFVVGADENFSTVAFSQSYENACLFAESYTVPPSAATIRFDNLSGSAVEVRHVEEQSRDIETVLGNEIMSGLVAECAVLPASDTMAPVWDTPTLQLVRATATTLRVDWAPGAVDQRLTGYHIYSNGALVATTTATRGLISGLDSSSSYNVSIQAFDLSCNESTDGPVAVFTTAEPTAPGSVVGTPYGSFLSFDNLDQLPQFTSARFLLSPELAIQQLEDARAANSRVVVAMVFKDDVLRPDGGLDLPAWKAELDRFAAIDFGPYVADGTVIANYLIDEPKAPGSWGGQVISNDTIDEMAAYSKSYWPDLPTIVRNPPDRLIRHAVAFNDPGPAPYVWQHLDAAWLQYSASNHGAIAPYTAAQINAAASQDLGMVFGLQMLAGGNGSSGIRPAAPFSSSKWIMSYNEVMNYGTYLLQQETACAFINFRWDRNAETYFSPGTRLREAHDDLQALAEAFDPAPCGLRR